MWTLVYQGTEKALVDWGVEVDLSRARDNNGRGTVVLRTIEAYDAGPTQWLAQEEAVIWRDRAAIGTGGTIWAQGWFDDPERQANGNTQNVTYRLHNVWWLLEQHVYQQPRQVVTAYNSEATPKETLTNLFTPEVYLGEAVVPGELAGYSTQMQTNGDEIKGILAWVNECFNATKRGATAGRDEAQDVLTVGVIEPQLYFGIKRVSSILCSEAIIEVLRLQPDSIVWVDEATVPPTVNVRTLGRWTYAVGEPAVFLDYENLPEVILNITLEQEQRVLTQGQRWKNLPAVIIYWMGSNSINGQMVPFCFIDDYPGGITTVGGGAQVPVDGYVPRAGVHFVVLEGYQVTTETAQLTVEPLSALVAGDQVAWWRGHDQTLNDPTVDPASISVVSLTIRDDSGALIDTGAYPNILLDSTLPSWAAALGVGWRNATIRSEIAFTKVTSGGTFTETKARNRMVHKRVKLTNAVTGPLTATTSITPAEAVPVGVAESIYRSVNAPQWAGSIEFVAATLRSDIEFGKRYRLVGPNTTFYNVLPQRIVERPGSGTTEMVYGPAPQASVDTLLEIMRATRFRTTWRMPSGRADGSDGSSSQVDTGADVPTDDTAHSPGGNSYDSTTHQVS